MRNKKRRKKLYSIYSKRNFSDLTSVNASTTKSSGVGSLELPKSNIILGEMANALSVGITDKEIYAGYRGVLDLQNNVLNSVDILQEKFVLTPAQVNKINSDFLSPLSGAVVDLGLNTINANKLFYEGLIKGSDLIKLQELSSISLDTIKTQQDFLISDLKKATSLENLITNPSILSIPMAATGLDMVTRAIPTFPSSIELPTLDAVRDRYFLNTLEINKEQEKLDNILRRIDPELVEIRKGCWNTFYTKGPDYIRQASSSMRGLVDAVLRTIAPQEFPTRKDKIYHAIHYNTKKSEQLKRIVKGFLGAYDNLSAWDHKPIKNDQFVQGVFIIIEGGLISLLSETREES